MDSKKPGLILAGILQAAILAYLGFINAGKLSPKVWIALWLISTLISAQFAVGKSFLNLSASRWMFLNQLASPSIIISYKLIYAAILSLLLAIFSLTIHSFFNGFPVLQFWPFFSILFLVSISLAGILTLTSAISSKSSYGAILFPVLSMPVLVPIFIVSSRAMFKCINTVLVPSFYTDLYFLVAINATILLLTHTLFSFFWKD